MVGCCPFGGQPASSGFVSFFLAQASAISGDTADRGFGCKSSHTIAISGNWVMPGWLLFQLNHHEKFRIAKGPGMLSVLAVCGLLLPE